MLLLQIWASFIISILDFYTQKLSVLLRSSRFRKEIDCLIPRRFISGLWIRFLVVFQLKVSRLGFRHSRESSLRSPDSFRERSAGSFPGQRPVIKLKLKDLEIFGNVIVSLASEVYFSLYFSHFTHQRKKKR